MNIKNHQLGNLRSIKRVIKPISVNIAIWKACNYQCKFCFGHYNGLEEEFVYDRIMEIPNILARLGTKKITVEGGEPFLYPHLKDFLILSKKAGLTTSVITNGSLITENKLREIAPYLDWIGISVDSPEEQTEILLGRGHGSHLYKVRLVSGWAHKYGIKLKINTVVTRYNLGSNLTELYKELRPERIKVFQFLHIESENDDFRDELMITPSEFSEFVNRHKVLMDLGYNIVFESNSDMTGSYVMLLPSGRFFNNYGGRHVLSRNTIFTDPLEALREIQWDSIKFRERGGLYEW